MSSKLQPHSELILNMLLSGSTYKKVVEALSEQGCTTSLTNLNDWVKRRHKRIVSRSHLINPQVDQLRPTELIPAISESVGNKTTPTEISQSIGHPPTNTSQIKKVGAAREVLSEAVKSSSDSGEIVLPAAVGFRTATIGKQEPSEISNFLDSLLANPEEEARRNKVNSFFTKKSTTSPSGS